MRIAQLGDLLQVIEDFTLPLPIQLAELALGRLYKLNAPGQVLSELLRGWSASHCARALRFPASSLRGLPGTAGWLFSRSSSWCGLFPAPSGPSVPPAPVLIE